MGMSAKTTEWTATMARSLPDDGNRYEVLDGELFVTPAPTASHQRIVGELFVRLREYVRQHPLGEALFSPADIEFSSRRLLQPDLFVVPNVGAARVRDWSEIKTLVLAVEVVSPSTARADRHRKRIIYQSQHVPEYWIVDGDARLVERWRPDDDRPEIVAEELMWRPPGDVAPLVIDLPRLFADALD
jgi:Uma2 family endonuclease